MKEHHKQWVGKVFDCAASQYGEGSCSFFNYFGQQLVKHVPIEANWQDWILRQEKGQYYFHLLKG